MNELHVQDVRNAFAIEDEEQILDKLNGWILRLKRSELVISPQVVDECLKYLTKIDQGSLTGALWELLYFSPQVPSLLTVGRSWLRDQGSCGRAQVLLTLANIFPAEKAELISDCKNDSDPFMLRAVAKVYEHDAPRTTWGLLVDLVESNRGLAPELRELLAIDLANLATESDKPVVERLSKSSKAQDVWKDVLVFCQMS